MVSIYHAGKLIETHERITQRGISKSTKRQHLKPWEQVCNNPNGLQKLAADIGPAVEIIVCRILKGGDGFIDFRRIWGILSLNKKYSHKEIDAACEFAIYADSLRYQTVLKFLEQQREALAESMPAAATPRATGKFQHNITEYSQLLLNLKSKGENHEH